MRKHVVQNVDRKNFGETQTTTGALYSFDAKLVGLNGLNEPHTNPSSKKPTSDRSDAPAAKAQSQGRKILCERSELRISSSRKDNQSPILVIYQLLLKNNTKYCGVFWRNCRGRWSF